MRKSVVLVSGIVILGLAGCMNPEQYESEPVVLKTAKGNVVCQLYTKERVDWDRAIQWPRGLDYKQADQLCRNEGYRQQRGE